MLLFALAFAAATDAPKSLPSRATCGRTSSYYALRPGASLAPQKLTELPDANLYIAVDRRVGGCAAPIIVRYKVTGR